MCEMCSGKRDDVVRMTEDTADALRKADQMTGQAFNDVGGFDEDLGEAKGVYRVQVKKETHRK